MLQYKLEKSTLINLFLRLDYLWYLNFKKKKNPFYLVQKHFMDTISTSTQNIQQDSPICGMEEVYLIHI